MILLSAEGFPANEYAAGHVFFVGKSIHVSLLSDKQSQLKHVVAAFPYVNTPSHTNFCVCSQTENHTCHSIDKVRISRQQKEKHLNTCQRRDQEYH